MQTPRFLRLIFLFAVTLVLPLGMSAASDALTVNDDAQVSRGDFLRAAVSYLDISLVRSKPTGTYTRPVARALQPYVRTAEKYDALAVFGKDLGLGRTITRGESLVVLMHLQNMKPSSAAGRYSDVKAGTDLEKAVRLAVEKGWMKPSRANFFGVDRALTGKEARALLKNVTGKTNGDIDTGPALRDSSETSVIKVRSRPVTKLPENEMLQAVWQLLNEQYLYSDKLDSKKAGYSAAEALVKSLDDPYTSFMRPVDAQQFQDTIDGQVSGIGAQVEYVDNALVIVAPISGSPAQKAGLKAGDRIVTVNGESIAGLSLNEAVNKVRGPRGVEVKLGIVRDGKSFDISVMRDTVRMPEIDISYQNDIAIVKLVIFGQTTDRELRTLMTDVQARAPRGIILDLRNNPGGLLHAAEIVLSNFLPQGSGVAMIKTKTLEYTEVTADKPTISDDIPVIVLVNKGSASASEIVAGSLQDYGRATVMGEKTFGKGTVQQIIDFRDGSSMKMTIAEWFTPKARKINGAGLLPDVAVTQSDTRDDQMLRALETLR